MILVTGGAGYIGGICAERLLEQGREVCVLDNLDRGYRDVIPDKAAFVETDLADRDALERVFRDYPIRAVMHFAAYALVGESMREPNLYFRNNFVNALNLLEAAQRAGVERFCDARDAVIAELPDPRSQLAAAIRRRELSPVEVVDAHIRRIEAVNPALNAVVAPCFDHARQGARAAERRLSRRGRSGSIAT